MRVIPWAFRCRTREKRAAVSPAERELVGSSMMMILAPVPTAAAICTCCSCPVVSELTRASTSIAAPMVDRIALARDLSAGRSTQPALRGRSPRQRFSATERLEQKASSWWTIAIPSWRASRGVCGRTGLPSTRISPASAVCTPARILPRVLLPAPFSPISAWQLPRAISKLTPSRARTPGNSFETERKAM